MTCYLGYSWRIEHPFVRQQGQLRTPLFTGPRRCSRLKWKSPQCGFSPNLSWRRQNGLNRDMNSWISLTKRGSPRYATGCAIRSAWLVPTTKEYSPENNFKLETWSFAKSSTLILTHGASSFLNMRDLTSSKRSSKVERWSSQIWTGKNSPVQSMLTP